MKNEHTKKIQELLSGSTVEESLSLISDEYPKQVVFSTSFGLEDQVLTHLIFSNHIPIKVFTLDTGRLFPETYAVWSRTRGKYNKSIHVYYPNENKLQNLVSLKGPNSFYESVDNRKECCFIRKVEPLRRALKGSVVWITGIRREQSVSRNHLPAVEWDEAHQLVKYHPLLDWSLEDVRQYIRDKDIPYNALHDKGFPSIGCQPCTRAVKEDEDPRAGRWWWEQNNKKECGLHTNYK